MTLTDIRLARAAERAALEELQRRASLALPDYRAQLEAHPQAIELPAAFIAEGRVLVAEDEAGVAGFAAWLDGEGADEAALDGLFVEPDRWRSGVGRALVEAVAAAAAGAGRMRLTVVANPGAVAFYASCGFVPAGETRTRFGPAPVMVRSAGP
ncbi:MAG TPA: GNAT family N-acetyltransferase [Allosphingosinicella sp.]|jgi:GNAT superfamily N-acetyltransferase|nr:GNAT family N-acetyltransferase [Allosphingosinicella sp.]